MMGTIVAYMTTYKFCVRAARPAIVGQQFPSDCIQRLSTTLVGLLVHEVYRRGTLVARRVFLQEVC